MEKNPRLVQSRSRRQRQKISHRHFVNDYFPIIENAPFNWGRHHPVICETLDRVLRGEIMRLIITIPPGYTKTMLATIMLAARGFAQSPRARFMHVSASNPLVLSNSNAIKDIMNTQMFRENFGVTIRTGQQAAGKWRTDQGGEFYAVPLGGTITGMRAGRLALDGDTDTFRGAMIMDDLTKAQATDQLVTTVTSADLRKATSTYHSTLRSRLFPPTETPQILIMQRLDYHDIAGHLLMGGSNEKWHHLWLPIEIMEGMKYPAEWTHGIEIPHGLEPGPLWPRIHDAAAIDALREPETVFAAQYMQQPMLGSGNMWKEQHFIPWADKANLSWRKIYVDTAQKQEEQNDFTVMQCWGKCASSKKAKLLDQVREKVDADGLLKLAATFWSKHSQDNGPVYGALQSIKVEDKVSGTGLIQQLRNRGIPVEAIERDRDKVSRANDVLPCFASGLVEHPPAKYAPWLQTWKSELLAFPRGVYDDQVDPTIDAVNDICLSGANMDWL